MTTPIHSSSGSSSAARTAPARSGVPELRRLARAGLAALLLLASAGAPAHSAPPEGSAEVHVLTQDDAPSIAADTVVLLLDGGMIDATAAGKLNAAMYGVAGRYKKLVLRLNSPGGSNLATKSMLERLAAAKQQGVRLRTMVHQGDVCASACLLLFMAGDERYAGNASAWGFHGACMPGTNVPSPVATAQFLADLEEAGIAPEFLDYLRGSRCMIEPGVLWLSGYEVHVVMDAGIITHLIPAFQPAYPVFALPLPPQ